MLTTILALFIYGLQILYGFCFFVDNYTNISKKATRLFWISMVGGHFLLYFLIDQPLWIRSYMVWFAFFFAYFLSKQEDPNFGKP